VLVSALLFFLEGAFQLHRRIQSLALRHLEHSSFGSWHDIEYAINSAIPAICCVSLISSSIADHGAKKHLA
jgi:hypothetical protein